METITYILSVYGSPRSVILAKTTEELIQKTALAVKEEVEADDTVVITLGILGEWGEDTEVKAVYTNDGQQIENTDITLLKTVSY